MLRGPNTLVPVRQFGGLRADLPRDNVSILDASDCLNVHTTYGSIERRPGTQVWNDELVATTGAYIRRMIPIEVALTRYLLVNYTEGVPADNDFLILNTDGTDSPDLTLTTSTSQRPSFAVADGIAYAVMGSWANSKKFYMASSAWTSARLGIAQPGTIGIALTVGGGSLVAGTYSWRITWYNENTDTESAPSAEITQVTALNDRVVLTRPSNSDAQVTHWRIYQKRPGSTNWYFQYQAPIAQTTHNDNGTIALDSTVNGLLNLFGPMSEECDACCWHQGRMWYHPEGASHVVHSDYNKPERVNSLNQYQVGGLGDVVAMYSGMGLLWVFHENEVFIIAGDSPENFVSTRIIREAGAGCIAEAGICEANGRLYWLGHHGLKVSDGTGVMDLGQPVAKWFDWYKRSPATLRDLSLVYESRNGWLMIQGLATDDSSVRTGLTLVYSPKLERWWRWDIFASTACIFQAEQAGATDDQFPFPYFATYDPDQVINSAYNALIVSLRIAQVPSPGTNNANGDHIASNTYRSIPWHWETGDLDLGVSKFKRWMYLNVAWRQWTGEASRTADFTLSYAMNQAASLTTLETWAMATQVAGVRAVGRPGRRGTHLRAKIAGVGTQRQGPWITAIEFDALPCGGR